MNLKSNLLRRLLFATVLLGVIPFALAGPGLQFWETMRTEAQFAKVKAEDRLVYVCKECNTVTELPAGSSAQAMKLCKEGATLVCPSCRKITKVVRKQSRNDPLVRTEVVYVNDKGEECAFIAKETGMKK